MRVPLYVSDQRILYDLKEGMLLVSRNPVTFFNQIFASSVSSVQLGDEFCCLHYHVGHGLWLRDHDCV